MLEVEIAQIPRFQGPFGPRPGHLPDLAPGIVIPRIGVLNAARHHGVHQPGIGLQRVPVAIHRAFIVSVMGDVPGRRGRDEPAAVGQGDGGDDGGHVILRLPRTVLEEPVGMVAGFPHHDGRMVVHFPHIDRIIGDVHVPTLPFPGPGRRLPDQVQAQLVGPARDARVIGSFRSQGPCMDMDAEEVAQGLGHQEFAHQLGRFRAIHRACDGFQWQPVAENLSAPQDLGPMVDVQHAFLLLDEADAGGNHAVIDGFAVRVLQNHLHLVKLRPVRAPTGRRRHPDVIFKDIIHSGTQFHGEFLLRHDRAFRGEPGAVADAQAPPIEDMVFPPDGNLMMLNRFLFFKGQGVRIDVRNPVGGIHKLERCFAQKPAEVVVGRGVEHDRIRKEGFYLDGNQVFLAGTQVLRHIQQIRCPAFQDSRGLSVDPDFPGRIQGVQMQERLGKRPDLHPGAKVIILPRLGGTAMGGRQRNRLPGCIVIASFLPASHGRDLLEIFIEDQFAPIGGRGFIGIPDEVIEGDSLHGSLSGHG